MTVHDEHFMSDELDSAIEAISAAMAEAMSLQGFISHNPAILFNGRSYYFGSSLHGSESGDRVVWDLGSGLNNWEPVMEDFLLNKDTYIYDLATGAAKMMIEEDRDKGFGVGLWRKTKEIDNE